ncbi:MAG: acetyl-CoA hydrolase/transferase C-terminal domain-containing protein [Dehalococcoidia bacterium]|nr:acetyl-CoA hydrolase/transferase C-terminal domain-containing protein [Dehalococcoidia bacterium]
MNDRLIRTYGDNYVHISEFDSFVPHTPTGSAPGGTDLLGRSVEGPDPVAAEFAEQVAKLVKDGDTLQVGVGSASEAVVRMGALSGKVDLGWHSEVTPRGIIKLVQEGVITGKHKTIHAGKVVAAAIGSTKEDMDYVNMNPMFELYDGSYIIDPRVISAHDNLIAINSALAVDLTGQISVESVGFGMVSGTGGQLAFAVGAQLSKGGRYVAVLPSTARGGALTRIVSAFEPGTIVSVPRTLADLVVTEYGIASLRGRSQRERAKALISIAHPDFRRELEKDARKAFYPLQ